MFETRLACEDKQRECWQIAEPKAGGSQRPGFCRSAMRVRRALNVRSWKDLTFDMHLGNGRKVPLFAVPHPRHATYGERISLHE